MMMYGIIEWNNFILVENKLFGLIMNFFLVGIFEESDVDDYYLFVIGYGLSFKVVDFKVYKYLCWYNI